MQEHILPHILKLQVTAQETDISERRMLRFHFTWTNPPSNARDLGDIGSVIQNGPIYNEACSGQIARRVKRFVNRNSRHNSGSRYHTNCNAYHRSRSTWHAVRESIGDLLAAKDRRWFGTADTSAGRARTATSCADVIYRATQPAGRQTLMDSWDGCGTRKKKEER